MNKRIVGLVFFLCAFLLCSSLAALANDQSALVVDNAKIFEGKLSQVEQAAGKLQRTGADVHVWTIETFAGEANSLDGYFDKLLKKFPAWQSSNGGRKNNLLVLMVATKDRKTGIYYGGEWSKPLGQNWVRIQADLMNPKFRRGEWAEGFSAGLTEISRVIHEYLHPSAARSQVVVVSGQPSQPTDFSGLWRVFGWLVFLAFLCIGVYFAYGAYTRRREEQERRNRAQQKAKIEKNGVVGKIASIKSAISDLDPLIIAVCGLLSQEESKKLSDKIEELKNNNGTLAAAFTATNSSAGNPDASNLSEAQYGAMEEKYGKVNDQADEVVALAEGLRREAAALRDVVGKAPEEEKRLKKGLAEMVVLVQSVEAKGFNVVAQRALLQEAATLLENLRGMIAERRYGEIPAAAKAIQAKYEEAEEGALALVDRQEKMEKAKDGIQEDVSVAEAKIAEAGEVLESEDPLVSEEARKILSQAGQKLVSAKKELKQAKPDYLKASQACQEALASAEKAMVLERKRQAGAAIEELRRQMRENPRNISQESRQQMQEIEATYRRADSGSMSNNDLLMMYLLLNNQSHQTIIVNQGHIESDTHFVDHGYRDRDESYAHEHGGSGRREAAEEDSPRGGSTNWGHDESPGSDREEGGGSIDIGVDVDSGGGGETNF